MKERLLSFLRLNPVATFVSLSSECTPQTATVYVYVDNEFNCYCLTKASTTKYMNIESRRTVALSFFNEEELVTCEIEGIAYALTAGEDVVAAVTQLQEVIASRRSGYWVPPVSQIDGSQFVVIKVVPLHISFSNYGNAMTTEQHRPYRVSMDLK